jgi:hypothetical protein
MRQVADARGVVAKSYVQRPANDQILLIVDRFFHEQFDLNVF